MEEEYQVLASPQVIWYKEAYLREKYPWADNYIYYYLHVCYADSKAIPGVLKKISESDYTSFSMEKAYNYFREYQRKKLNFAIVIPTANRAEEIKFLLEYTAPICRCYGMDIIIYDSSTNDLTRKYTEQIKACGYFNVRYVKYTGKFDGFSLDHKIIQAYIEFGDEYEFLWLCRDGLIPVVTELVDKFMHYKEQKVDCIIVDTKSRTDNLEIEKIYETAEDAETLLLEQALRLQTLGMLIFSTRFAKKLIREVPLDDTTYSLWQMAAPFHLFAKQPYKIVFTTRDVFAPNYKAKSAHFWGEKTLEQWARRWSMVINGMPSCYDTVKKQCMMVYTVDFHPFSARNVLGMRAEGGLNCKIERKYERYLKDVTFTPIWYFRLVATMPKWGARLALKIADKHIGTMKKLRRKLIFDKRD